MLIWIEWMVCVLAIVLLALHFMLANYGIKRALVHTIAIVPFIYFSVSMLTEVVTADELQYISAFVNPENIKIQGEFAMKVLYEYKLSQVFMGTFFTLIPAGLRELVGWINLYIIYKILHYFLMYIIILLIALVWRRQIFENKEDERLRISESVLLIALIGLPLSCLLLKVCNYDSGSTYPALLGFSLLWGAYKKDSVKEGFAGTLITAFGVLEKWTALPYWCICVVLFAHLVYRKYGKYPYGFLAVIVSYIATICISFVNLLYIKMCQGGLCAPINIGNVTFSFTHAMRAVLSGNMRIDYGDVNAYSGDAFKYIMIIVFTMSGCFWLMEFIFKKLDLCHINIADFINKLCAIILILSVILGVVATYCIPLKISPYSEIEEGYYVSTDTFGGWTYHYGARTAIGHFACKICYMCAVIICSYPTIVTALAVVISILIIKKKLKNNDGNFFAGLLWSCSILLLILYAVGGLPPSDAKYYTFSIYVLVMSGIYYLNQFYCRKKVADSLMIGGSILFVIEMIIYSPNIKNFSPAWVVHSDEHNKKIRIGEWYAGENMLWGEELAIGGNKIKKIVNELNGDADYSQICIYTNYGGAWFRNFGKEQFFTVKNMYSDINEIRFDENSYYIFNKFVLFRGEIPDFIYKVEPVDTIEFKGDIGAWIYRGDQLKEYKDYFEKVNQ